MLEDKVNILLVDDQPAKLLTYQAILGDVGETLLTANNATEALELLLRNDVAVVLIDVYMPDIDGFQLAAMIRNHPRFEKTAVIFVSGVHLSHLRSGRRDNPSARLLAALADLLGVPLSYFFDPDAEDRVNAELDALTAGRDPRAKQLMIRAQGLSPAGMDHLEAILEHLRQIEGLNT